MKKRIAITSAAALGLLVFATTINAFGAEISQDKAKEIALEHAKVAENSLIFDKVEKDYEDRRLVYEVEFVTNDGMEYDYEIDASSGTIVKYDFDAEYYAPSGTSRSRRQNGSSQAADASQKFYDTILKGYGQTDGIRSYGTVVDLLVAYYRDTARTNG